jgi:hypothetical protein
MTQRKPPGEKWETLIERQIREAQAEGRFDSVDGAGRPLPGVEAPYDPNWWAKQWMRRERVSDLPPALAIRARVQQEIERLFALDSEEEVRRGLIALDAEVRKTNATVTRGPSTTLGPLDVESLIESWRARRRAPPSDRGNDRS